MTLDRYFASGGQSPRAAAPLRPRPDREAVPPGSEAIVAEPVIAKPTGASPPDGAHPMEPGGSAGLSRSEEALMILRSADPGAGPRAAGERPGVSLAPDGLVAVIGPEESGERRGRASNGRARAGITGGTAAPAAAPSDPVMSPYVDFAVEPIIRKAVGLQAAKIPILITGESGVGKDHLVRRLHAEGPRGGQPMVAINCAAIPRDLIESELFGYEGGSFTGARSGGKRGKFVQADRGILFLDEIGDMALDLQTRLLRVLDNSEIVPVGGTSAVKIDVHVIAATNQDLAECVQKGKFRRDLYYRLVGAQFRLPSLRERPDKSQLIRHLLAIEMEAMDKAGACRVSEEVWRVFMGHPWPGNVRELRNVLRAAIAVACSEIIGIDDLPGYFLDEAAVRPAAAEKEGAGLAGWEQQAVRSALQASNGNIAEAARQLGVTRATLYRKIHRYDIKR
jgi:sigma-54 dependent transcriptional regulator, acetoin dehydrogenase operon transcriptional activator AcoR